MSTVTHPPPWRSLQRAVRGRGSNILAQDDAMKRVDLFDQRVKHYESIFENVATAPGGSVLYKTLVDQVPPSNTTINKPVQLLVQLGFLTQTNETRMDERYMSLGPNHKTFNAHEVAKNEGTTRSADRSHDQKQAVVKGRVGREACIARFTWLYDDLKASPGMMRDELSARGARHFGLNDLRNWVCKLQDTGYVAKVRGHRLAVANLTQPLEFNVQGHPLCRRQHLN